MSDATIGAAGGAFLGIGFLLAAASVAWGRRICRRLETRRPDFFEASGRPWPSLLGSSGRDRFYAFLFDREYLKTGDAEIVTAFDNLRIFHMVLIGLVVAGFLGLGVAILLSDTVASQL